MVPLKLVTVVISWKYFRPFDHGCSFVGLQATGLVVDLLTEKNDDALIVVFQISDVFKSAHELSLAIPSH